MAGPQDRPEDNPIEMPDHAGRGLPLVRRPGPPVLLDTGPEVTPVHVEPVDGALDGHQGIEISRVVEYPEPVLDQAG